MSLSWLLNRLRSMSPAEIAHRVREKAKKSRDRGALEGWQQYQCPGPVPIVPGLSQHLEAQGDTVWVARECESLLAGEFAALGVAWPIRSPDALFSPDLWRLDPVSGDLWPGADKYCFDIPYRHERRLGDVKYVWEINRLQFLQPLAFEVWATGKPAALAAIEAAIQSWYRANPPFRGIGWNSGIELGLRAISLLVVTNLCGERLSPETIARVRTMLHAHAFWMNRYPSRYSSANNHLIAEAAGEFLVALAMPDLPFATGLEAKSRRILEEEAEKQFHGDGVPAEQSPTYGAFSAEFLWLCAQTAEAAGRPLSPAIHARLARFAEYIDWLRDGRGRVPAIGDDDEGRVLWLGPPIPSYPVHVCRAFADSTGSRRGLRTFPEGGYTVVREECAGRVLGLTMDHGPLGYLAIAAHGHADALALVVDLDGEPLFVDPGTYLYHSGGAWRDWFRGTRAHNTLNIRGENQSRIAGAFNWRTKAKCSLQEVRDGPRWLIRASHDGYRKRYGVDHERVVSATDKGFSIHDRLLGRRQAERPVELVFQLAPQIEIEHAGNTIRLLRHGLGVAQMEFPEGGQIAVSRGGPGFDGGWVSPGFGHKEPAGRIAWHGLMPESGLRTNIEFCA